MVKGINRRQKPVKGGRTPLPACVIQDISDEVARLSHRFGVSKSFVIAVALADQFGIAEQETYLHTPIHIRKKKSR